MNTTVDEVREGNGGDLKCEYTARRGVLFQEERDRGIEHVAVLGGASPQEIESYQNSRPVGSTDGMHQEL